MTNEQKINRRLTIDLFALCLGWGMLINTTRHCQSAGDSKHCTAFVQLLYIET
jgi:hypothetical protein